jgi:dTMP kinase
MYVVFEGIDGCGKTSLARSISERLNLLNITPIRVQEPSRGRYGLQVRERMKTGVEPWDPELHRLFTLDRQDHVVKKIRPALELVRREPGFALIQDRGYLSAPAYQANDDGRIFEMLKEQRAIAPPPDRFFLINVPLEIAMTRLVKRSDRSAAFEQESFLEAVQRRYQKIGAAGVEPITQLNGTLEPQVLVDIVLGALKLK